MKSINLFIIALICVLVIVVFISSTTHRELKHERLPLSTEVELVEKKLGRKITMEAEEGILHYREDVFWSEDDFSDIMKNQGEFKFTNIGQFNELYNVNADNFEIEFDRENNSTILKCDVHGKFTGSWYDFHWFLNPLGLDFIDSNFLRSEKELSWEGNIDGVPTIIYIRFPFPISNCHAHVWAK